MVYDDVLLLFRSDKIEVVSSSIRFLGFVKTLDVLQKADRYLYDVIKCIHVGLVYFRALVFSAA